MDKEYILDKTFENLDFTETGVPKGEYESCRFMGCNFSATELTEIRFVDCLIDNCNISNAVLINTAFINVKFRHCKMLGLQFENCAEFGLKVDFEQCFLGHSSFTGANFKGTVFADTKLTDADFTLCDLRSSSFENCDFSGAVFDKTNLEKADLRTSFGYSIDPDKNRIKKAKFSLSGLPGLLDKYDIDIEL